MTPGEIWKLFKKQIPAALEAAQTELATAQDAPTQQELHAIIAWCYYRQAKYDQAFSEIDIAGDNKKAKECKIHVRAYSKAHRDDAEMMALAKELGETVSVANSMVVRARDTDSIIEHGYIWQLAEKFVENSDVANHDDILANLLHNCARFFLDKARNRKDLIFALGLLKFAMAHYGDVSNWHHRAAAMFWMSHVLEKLTAIADALKAAAASLHLWQCQVQLDENTEPYRIKLENAQKRVIELTAKMVEFALRSGVKATK